MIILDLVSCLYDSSLLIFFSSLSFFTSYIWERCQFCFLLGAKRGLRDITVLEFGYKLEDLPVQQPGNNRT